METSSATSHVQTLEWQGAHVYWQALPDRSLGRCEHVRDAFHAATNELPDEERARLAALCTPELRLQAASARALLRRALSRHAEAVEGPLRFERNRLGRLTISTPRAARSLRFSVTHTRGAVACVVSRECDVGVDLEPVARAGSAEAGAEFFCGERELRTREALGLERWLLKEACLKALGLGLWESPRSIQFERRHSGIWELVEANPRILRASWQFAVLRPTAHHLLGLALRGQRDEGAPS